MKKPAWLLGLSILTLSPLYAESLAAPAASRPGITLRDDPVPQIPASPMQLPVTGTLADGRTFTGTLAVTSLALDDSGQLLVNGVLTGIVGEGTERQLIEQVVSAIAAILKAGSRGCDLVTLDLGPLNLDVLGLVVDLSPVNLDVIAQPGSGNLLGNLLCAVAHLLDNPLTSLLGLGALLEQINEILAGG